MSSVAIGGGMLRVEINVAEFNRAKRAISMANSKGTYRGMFRDEIKKDLRHLTAYAKRITHKESGVLALSHTWEYDSYRTKGRIFINPQISWIQGRSVIRRPHIYGFFEHARGGSHAFYDRTVSEAATPRYILDGLYVAVKGIPWP
jgi:hypothetical protein